MQEAILDSLGGVSAAPLQLGVVGVSEFVGAGVDAGVRADREYAERPERAGDEVRVGGAEQRGGGLVKRVGII